MLRAEWAPYTLRFRETAITSRQRMQVKDTYFIRIYDTDTPEVFGVGECPLFRGLSAEDTPDYEKQLAEACRTVAAGGEPAELSSVRFGIEMALNDLRSGGRRIFFDSPWSRDEQPLTINGLVWMGDRDTMARRIEEKLHAGFRCVKLKIGGIDFDQELGLLELIRSRFPADVIELRLDANGAFTPANAMSRLEQLARYDIHSIEQPIRAGQWREMAYIAAESPIPVALDEELIGHTPDRRKDELLDEIKPQYIILKPALCGGFAEADRWIDLACERGIGWWATSALESDLGLAAIGQWVSRRNPEMPQGLGTGQLYTNNIPSPLRLDGERLSFNPEATFELPYLNFRT